MDDTSVLTEGTALNAHDIMPQLPGYRSNKHVYGRSRHVMKYFEGQRFVLDAQPSFSARKIVDDQSATGLMIGMGGPYHSLQPPKKYFDTKGRPQVLCFQAFFKEAVHESPLENFRVHKCDIFYYTEDDSIEITERKYENSGMTQGNFMKRHQVPKDEDEFFTLDDLVIGEPVTFYNRTFQIIDANIQTKAFIAARNDAKDGPVSPEQAPGSAYPEDKYESNRSLATWDPDMRYNIQKNPTRVFAEAMLGKTCDNTGRAGFLKYDRKVLRFVCIWDDRESLYGDVQQFKLHYYLTDDTFELISVFGPNSGRDPSPLMLKRNKVPKDMKDESLGFYTWADLRIGGTISVYSRPLLLVDADKVTREFYESQGMPLSEPQMPPEEEPPQFMREVPPPTGFGSEEDSLTSCVGSLVQHPPRKVLGQDKILRFLSRFRTSVPEEMDREFVVSYFLVDKTISVHEPPRRNSGIIGGQFLSRISVASPKLCCSEEITPSIFYVGGQLTMLGHTFVFVDTDSGTLDFMEENPDLFPYSDYNAVAEKAAKVLADACDDGSFAKACNDAADDPTGGGSLTAEAFKGLMNLFGLAVPEQQCITLFRGLSDSAGTVAIDQLVKEFSP